MRRRPFLNWRKIRLESLFRNLLSTHPGKRGKILIESNKMTDYEIIEACLDGNYDYFSELVSRYKNLVYSIILRMVVDKEEANDLAQEVFIKVYKNLDKYYPEFKFSTWIMRITTNHVIDARRKKKHQMISISIDERQDLTLGVASPEVQYIEKESAQALKEIVESLPDMYKIPIILYHQQGLSYQEIASVIEEPLSKVKNRIFRGRKILQESLLSMKEGAACELQ